MNYTAVYIKCDPEACDILIAELSERAFESFEETERGFTAYIPEKSFDPKSIDEILAKYENFSPTDFRVTTIPPSNWNERWEQNFNPVSIGNVYVRAPFHPDVPTAKHEIVVSPKMSFGTGHHETTQLMINYLQSVECRGKAVLDVGTGTGILAILAVKLGAQQVMATDIDEWSIINCQENFALNDVNIEIFQGAIDELKMVGKPDIMLANINKNILINEMKHYSDLLIRSGHLLLSGFYVKDEEDIVSGAAKSGLTLVKRDDLNNWSILIFRKTAF